MTLALDGGRGNVSVSASDRSSDVRANVIALPRFRGRFADITAQERFGGLFALVYGAEVDPSRVRNKDLTWR